MATDIYFGYGWEKSHIGSCCDGVIYSGYGWGRTQIGTYDGTEGGAAAAALLLMLR